MRVSAVTGPWEARVPPGTPFAPAPNARIHALTVYNDTTLPVCYVVISEELIDLVDAMRTRSELVIMDWEQWGPSRSRAFWVWPSGRVWLR